MYDAGSAAFTLGAHVVRSGFESYGRLVEGAKREKEHTIMLGARTVTEGFDRFAKRVVEVKDATRQAAVSIRDSMAGISGSTDKMAVTTDAGLGKVRAAVDRTGQSFAGLGAKSRELAGVVRDEQNSMDRNVTRTAEVYKGYADEVTRSNARVAESNRAAAASAGGGGRGGAGGAAVAAAAGGNPEQQAKRATAEWKKGYETLAGLGKWSTIGFAAAGAVAVKWAADFQRNMTLLHTQAGASIKEVSTLRQKVLDLAPTVGIGPTKLAQGLFHVESAGFRGAKAMEVLKTAAEGAKVGNADLESVTNALVGVLNTAPKDIHSTAEAMGVLNDIVGKGNMRMQELTAALGTGLLPAGKAVGLGLRDVGAALDVLTTRGVPAQEGATRLRTVLSLIANPTQKAQKALDELGFSQDTLAKDFRSKGLVGALQDLQGAMGHIFGHKLSIQEETQALQNYGQQLQDSGMKAAAIKTHLEQFKRQLDKTGEGAIQSSQLIAQAFGGARMGTTMQILMQNVDSVKSHFNDLNKAGAAQRFQEAWKVAQKDFSVQAGQLWAGIQRLGVQLGDWLIPKLKDLVTWLIEAGKWLGHHKVIAEALAVVFGTLLVGAITAFFTKLIIKAGEGVISIGKFGKSIYELPTTMSEATKRMVTKLEEQQAAIEAVRKQEQGLRGDVLATDEAMAGASAPPGLGGGGGGVGSILGMIEGILGPEAPGSRGNPLAVFVVDPSGGGIPMGPGGKGPVVMPGERGVGGARPIAAEPMPGIYNWERPAPVEPLIPPGEVPPGEVLAAEAGGVGGLRGAAAKGVGFLGGMGSRLMRGAGVAGIGVMGAQMVGGMIGGKAGGMVSSIGTGAAAGAGIGSMIAPGIGTAVGGALGAGVAAAIKLFGEKGKSYGEQIAGSLTKGFGGPVANDLKKSISSALDEANKIATKGATIDFSGAKLKLPKLSAADQQRIHDDFQKAGRLVAQQLEQGWSSYKFQDEPTMFKQLRAETRKLPPEAQAAAIQSAVKFAQGLAKEGKLPKDAAQNMLNQAKSVFPGFEKYLGLTAQSSMHTFNKAFDFAQTEKHMRESLDKMRGDFPTVVNAMDHTAGSVEDKSRAVVAALNDIIKHGTGPMKDQARKDLRQLHDDTVSNLTGAESVVKAKSDDMKKDIAAGSSGAAKAAAGNFANFQTSVGQAVQSGVISVNEGNRLINKALNDTLKAFGTKGIPGVVQVDASSIAANVKSAAGSILGNIFGLTSHQAGGFLPGGEFGHQDVMTLIDPMGRPRARMAGDEAIFNRHQMPYVDAGLKAIGFGGANDLWSRVNAPHGTGFQKGGKLPGFAGGGSLVTASVFSDPQTASGITGVPGFAELSNPPGSLNFSAMGHLPFMTMVGVTYPPTGGKTINIPKIDVGAGGSALPPATVRAIDLTTEAAALLPGFPGLANVMISIGGLGGAAGAAMFKPIPVPNVKGTGTIADISRAALKKITDAANTWGQAHMPQIGPGGAGGPATTTPPPGSTPATIDAAMTAAANQILGKPYIFGGGHGGFGLDAGYDCSGAVSYVLHAGGFTGTPMDTVALASWGQPGPGKYVTVADLANPGASGHTMMSFFGKYFESGGGGGGPHWDSGWSQSFPLFRHPAGYAQGGQLGDFGQEPPERLLRRRPDLAQHLDFQKYSKWYHGQRPGPRPGQGHGSDAFARGGRLPGFQTGGAGAGGNPWAALPSSVTRLPGFRPPRVRRGASGLHVVGGRRASGSTKSTKGSHTLGTVGATRGRGGNKKISLPISQGTANLLSSLGFGDLAGLDNALGKLDNQYSNQENLFNLFDAGAAGLPQSDLDVLMGIREQEWDLLYNAWQAIPKALAVLGNRVAGLAGTPPPGWGTPSGPGLDTQVLTTDIQTALGGPDINKLAPGQTPPPVFHPPPGSVAGLTAEIGSIEKEIDDLSHDFKLDTRKAATIHHFVSRDAILIADQYAGQIASILNDLSVITDERHRLAEQRIGISQQLTNLTTSSKSSGQPSVNQLVGQVMHGGGGSTSTSSNNPQKRRLHNQLHGLQLQEVKLSEATSTLRAQLRTVNQQKASDLRTLRLKGGDAAWVIQLTKWKLQDRIDALRMKLKKLKAKLAEEKQALGAAQAALAQVQAWATGGLGGTSSAIESLGAVGMEMLGLYQQGAHLPTPDRKAPTLQTVEDVLTKMGLKIPAGLTQGIFTATQAWTDFSTFQAERQALFSQFGSNFVPAGGTRYPDVGGQLPAGQVAAGRAYYGAVPSGPTGLAGGGWIVAAPPQRESPGGTTVEIHQNFKYGPPDPHTYAAGIGYELRAAV